MNWISEKPQSERDKEYKSIQHTHSAVDVNQLHLTTNDDPIAGNRNRPNRVIRSDQETDPKCRSYGLDWIDYERTLKVEQSYKRKSGEILSEKRPKSPKQDPVITRLNEAPHHEEYGIESNPEDICKFIRRMKGYCTIQRHIYYCVALRVYQLVTHGLHLDEFKKGYTDDTLEKTTTLFEAAIGLARVILRGQR